MTTYTPKQFSKALRDLTKVPSQIAGAVAKEISRDIQKNFDAGQDPYKKGWQALAASTLAKGRHPPPLTDTRKGRRGVKVFPAQGAGVNIVSQVGYMGVHQEGWGPIPRRSFLPIGVLPRVWKKIWETELGKGVRKRISGK